jgi:CRP/FNR family transcriptional regulator, anaerobic regulatory protein
VSALRKFIENYTKLSDSDWHIIQMAFVRKEVVKNEILVAEGKICKYFFFLEMGLVRCFINNDGIDVTKFFTIAPYCFTSKNSFREKVPAQDSIQALDDCIVWQITLEQADSLLELKSWNEFVRKFLHEVQNHFEETLMEIRSKTAEQRYYDLLVKYPVELDKIPLKHLSSYLGIAPQSLSRIRKKRQF